MANICTAWVRARRICGDARLAPTSRISVLTYRHSAILLLHQVPREPSQSTPEGVNGIGRVVPRAKGGSEFVPQRSRAAYRSLHQSPLVPPRSTTGGGWWLKLHRSVASTGHSPPPCDVFGHHLATRQDNLMFLVATSGCPQGGKSTRWCHHPLPPRRYMRARRIRTSQYLVMFLDATLPAHVATPVAARQYLVMIF